MYGIGMSNLKIGHDVTITIREPPPAGEPRGSGMILEVRRLKNLVVDTGLNVIRDLIGGTGLRPDIIAVGTGSTAVSASDTALVTQVFSQAIDRRTRIAKKVTLQILISQSDANGNTLAEEGVFEGSTLIARALISPPIAKTSSIELTISHQFTLAAS